MLRRSQCHAFTGEWIPQPESHAGYRLQMLSEGEVPDNPKIHWAGAKCQVATRSKNGSTQRRIIYDYRFSQYSDKDKCKWCLNQWKKRTEE